MRVVISEFIDPAAMALLASAHDVTQDDALVDRPHDLERALATAHALIVRNRTKVSRALLEHAPHLQVVGRLGVGLDNIDLEACRQRGVQVIPATGANAGAVAEYVVLTAMLLLRRLADATADVAAGRWPRNALSSGREIAGKTLGVVGFGSIGRAVAALARKLDVTVLAHDALVDDRDPVWQDSGVRPLPLHELLAASDIVTLHVPLGPTTRHLIDAKALAAMRADAVLINTARGGIVDEAALAAALRAGRLGGAAVDVFEQEPLPADSPFSGCPRLVLTPHIAGVTAESNVRVSMMIAREVMRALATTDNGTDGALLSR